MNYIRSRRLVAAAGAISLVAACSGGGAGASPSTGTSAAPNMPSIAMGSDAPGTPAPTMGATFDQAFIDMMVPHHESAVAMAEIALERAERPEIKRLASEIVAAQESEIKQLRAWRADWFGSDQTPGMEAMPMLPGMEMAGHGTGGKTDMTGDIEALRVAEPFDRAFIEAMIPHHETAIAAAQLAQAQAEQPEIGELAEEIITAQEREITQMKEWLDAWY